MVSYMKRDHAQYVRFLRMLRVAKHLNLHNNDFCRFTYSEISELMKF